MAREPYRTTDTTVAADEPAADEPAAAPPVEGDPDFLNYINWANTVRVRGAQWGVANPYDPSFTYPYQDW